MRILMIIICLISLCHSAHAEVITLKNGKVFEGSIVDVNDEEGFIVFRLGKASKMGKEYKIKIKEIVSIKKEEEEKRESKEKISESEKYVNNRIDNRVNRQIAFRRHQDKQDELKKQREHEKSLLLLEAQMQLMLLEASAKMGIKPNVNVGTGFQKKCFHNRETGVCY